MTTYKGLTVEIGADTKGLTSALRDASKGARETQNELKQVERALKFDPSSARLLARQLELVDEQAKQTKGRLEALYAAERKYRNNIGDGKGQMRPDQWNKLQVEIATTESRLESFNAKMARLNREQGFAKVKADAEASAKKLAEVEAELSGVSDALKAAPGDARLMAQQFDAMSDRIDAAKTHVDMLKAAQDGVSREDLGDDEWRKLERSIAAAEGKLESYKAELAQARIDMAAADSAMGRFGASLGSFGEKYGTLGTRMATMGDAMTRTVTPALVGVGAASVAAATSIDTSLTNVKKTVDGTEQQYAALKESAIEFSKTNAVSASQVLDIQALGAQLGFTVEELEEFGRVASGLDIATNMDAETASTNMAQFANITGMAHDEISNYASALVGLGNSYATTESDISNMAMRLAAAGTQVGMSQADILGLATALSSMGMEAEAGGSAVSTIMANIDKAVATGSADMAAWAQAAGMSAEQFASAWKSSPVDALSAVLAGLSAATEEGGNMSLMLEELGISELRQTDAMKRLAGNAEYLGEAVKTANDEWSANTALSDEVANRNESLAAKFEMLKNRAVAVADQVGGPLADALLQAIDAAQPLFDAIESGAKAFSDMSEGEQQAVLGAIALVGAVGPLLSIVGRIPAASKAVGTAMQAVSKHFATVADSSIMVQTGMKGAEASTKGATTAAKAGRVAFSALGTSLKMVGIGFAVAAIAMLVDHFAKAEDKARRLDAATKGLSDAVGMAQGDFSGSSQAAERYAESMGTVAKSAEECIDAQGELAESMADAWGDIGTDTELLSRYVDVVDSLAGKSDLSAQEQSDLANAVAGINEICGTNYSVIDAANGVLNESTDAIKRNTDAWIANSRAQAAQEQMVELQKQEIETTLALAESKQKISDMETEFQGVRKAALAGDRDAIAREQELVNALETERGNRDALTDTLSENAAAQERLAGIYANEQEKLSGTAAKLQEAIAANDEWTAALSEGGIDVQTFADQLSALGVKTADLSGMTSEQMLLLAQNAGLSAEEIVAAFDSAGVALPESIRNALMGAASAASEGDEAMRSAGQGSAQAWLAGFNQGTQQAVLAASQLSGMTVAQIQQTAYQFGIEGNEATQAFANALAQGWTPAQAAALALKGAAVDGVSPMPAEMAAKAQDAVGETASTLSGGVGPVSDAASAVGSGAADSFGSGLGPMPDLASGVANETASALTPPLWGAASDAAAAGDEAGGGYADGVHSGIGPTDAAASSIAAKTLLMKIYSAMARSWGAHMGGNFAGGLISQVGKVSAAANALAQAAAAPLKHTTPDVGPLKDDDMWGGHLAGNIADGMRSGIPDVAKASAALASTVADYLAHTQPRKGPLSGGEWVYGYHAATNFAEGLYAGGGAVGDAAAGMLDDADEEMKKYIADMIAWWEDRSDEVREASTAIGDAVWGGIYGSVMNSPYRKPATGAVYDSMKVLESYGYDLDEYADKVAEFADKRAEWDSKLAGEMSDSDWSSYNEWLAEYNDFAAMQGQLPASLESMREFESLYALKDSAISGIDNAKRWSDALSALASKTGVAFSKEFVEAVKDGGDDYLRAIEQMADMSAEDAQRIVDSYQDLAIAQKQQELDQRSLYVNSLKYMTFETPKQRMVDFREACLDVKEAVYSDAGLSAAFVRAGATVEGFAADLMAMDVAMADFAAGVGDYSASVSNGFQRFTKHGKTGLSEWEETLRLNMAESQAWADNLEAVFAKVPESIDSEAFRKAVYEGGFEQWGQVIADMAGQSSEQIAGYISLYNQSIAQATTDGVNAFRALSPGEEMANAVIAGIHLKQPEMDGVMLLAAESSNAAIMTTAPQWNASGQSLAHEVAAGIQSQIDAIAAAAAATVSAALSAARSTASAGVAAAQAAASRIATAPAAVAASQVPRGFAATQRARMPQAAPTVNMNFTVNTRPGQAVDVRGLAREINTLQAREMKARGLR